MDNLETRLYGTLDERLGKLSASLGRIGVFLPKERMDLLSLSVLTQRLDIIANSYDWREVVINLIQVAEIWTDRSLAAHVLRWISALPEQP